MNLNATVMKEPRAAVVPAPTSAPLPAAPTADGAAESLAEKAYRLIEEKIVTLDLKPGAMLSEFALSRMLGIGRTPVREALHRLGREGLVTVLPRRGILVAGLDVREQLQMLEVRREIERLMARKSAERATDEEREAFRRLAADMMACADAGDDIGFMRLDHQFNNLLVRASRNVFLTKSIALMVGLSRRFWFMHNQRHSDICTTAARHAAVARAIARADSDSAARHSDKLMDHIKSITLKALDW